MKKNTKKIGQNIIILKNALKEENINKKINICKFTNDNGIYCSSEGLIERLEIHKKNNNINEINRLIKHVLNDLKIMRG